MALSQNDINIALEYAKTVRLTATLEQADNKTIKFHISKELPTTIKDEDVKDLVDIAIKYYQRSIFTGEYLTADDDPPARRPGEPIDDINFYLSYYKNHLITELKKAFDLDENLNIIKYDEGPKMSPYVQIMLEHRKKMLARKKK